MNESLTIDWQGELLQLLADRAVFWPKEKTIYIADTHFGKAATFRKVGIPVSEHTTMEDCQRLGKLIDDTRAQKLVILGDFLHARAGRSKPVRNLLFNWRDQYQKLSIDLVRGNHDLQSGDPWPEMGITCLPDPTPSKKNTWELRHLPPDEEVGRPFLAGHLHPGYRLHGKGRDSLRCPCWVVSEKRIILPAFGSFTGLKNIKHEKDEKIFLTNGKEIQELG